MKYFSDLDKIEGLIKSLFRVILCFYGTTISQSKARMTNHPIESERVIPGSETFESRVGALCPESGAAYHIAQ